MSFGKRLANIWPEIAENVIDFDVVKMATLSVRGCEKRRLNLVWGIGNGYEKGANLKICVDLFHRYIIL